MHSTISISTDLATVDKSTSTPRRRTTDHSGNARK